MTKTVKHKHPGPKAGETPGGKIAPLALFTLKHLFFSSLPPSFSPRPA